MKYLVFFSILLSFIACGPSSSKMDNQEKKIRVMVVCDGSSSVLQSAPGNISRLDQLKKYIVRIPKWDIYPVGTEIYYFPVSKARTSKLLGDSAVCYNIKMRSQVKSEQYRVDLLTKKICTEIETSVSETKNSCISLSINRAIDKIREINIDSRGQLAKNEIIIISDLLECCQEPDNIKISMKAGNIVALEQELRKFGEQHTDLKVSDLNLTIKVIYNGPGMGAELDKIQEVWKRWFMNIGVDKANIIFYTGEPNIKTNKFLN